MIRLAAFVVLLLAASLPAGAQRLLENGYLLPVMIDGQVYRLEAYAARLASERGPLPLVIISHGTAGELAENEVTHASNFRLIVRDFARRGWHAVSITRRGFGVSEGAAAMAKACNAPSRYQEMFRAYSADVLAAVETISRNTQMVDQSRVLFVGASTGGLTSLAAAARRRGSKTWAINFSGGIKSDRCAWEDHAAEVFADAAREAQGAGALKSLWIYAGNDSFFPPRVAEKFLEAHKKAGGDARYVTFDAIGDDGHSVFSDFRGREKWLPEVDRFLADHGLPHLKTDITDQLHGELKLLPRQKDTLRRYLALPGEKVLVTSGNGQSLYWVHGSSQRDLARKRALDDCGKKNPNCRVLLVNHALPEAPVAGPAAPSQPTPGTAIAPALPASPAPSAPAGPWAIPTPQVQQQVPSVPRM